MTLMPVSEYELMAQVEDQHWWYESLRRNLSRSLAAFPPGTTVLDAGCGTGRNALHLSDLGFNVTASDLSPTALNFVKRRGIDSAVRASVMKLPWKARSFEVVICCDVLGTLANESEVATALHEFYRVLKPGGTCIVQVAAFEWLYSTHDVAVHNRIRFTASQFEALLDPDSWKVEKMTYRYFLLFPLILFSKWWQRIQRVPSQHSDLALPPRAVNSLLKLIMNWEDKLLNVLNFPVGSSLYIELTKKS